MAAAARLGDSFSCGDTVGEGSGNVFFNGMPAARVGDITAGHECGPPTIILPPPTSANVFINGLPAAVVGCTVQHGTCDDPPHIGTLLVGSPDVSIG